MESEKNERFKERQRHRNTALRRPKLELGIVKALVVPDVEDRGLSLGLQALTPEERDVFVVYDLQLYHEMEGCFADHIGNAPEKFDWLEDTLKRIGDLGSLRLVRQMRELDVDASAQASALCEKYHATRDFRWTCLERYLLGQGIELKWDRSNA